MLFTSYEFLGFLLAVTAIYYLLYGIRQGKYQWVFLLAASLYFYAQAGHVLGFLFFVTITVWLGALLGEKRGKGKKYFGVLALFVLFANLFLLFLVKYRPLQDSVMIPMGISFYMFQALSYLLDVYHKKYPAEKNLLRFALFVSFFPQLVQGPISRYDELSETLYQGHAPQYKNIAFGAQRILWGFFKKLVVADRLLPAVTAIISQPEEYTGGFVFVGMMFYALELYADFTGGIDITIGIARMLGIRVRENFIRPYFAKNIKEYWKRWHITMGSWFREYVFYTMAIWKPVLTIGKKARKCFGNEIGKRVPVYLAAFCTWLATGIWHGRGANFVAWGLGNFIVIMISQELEGKYRKFRKKHSFTKTKWYDAFQVLRTIFLMSCLRMFDCYRDVGLTFRMFFQMFTRFSFREMGVQKFLNLGLTEIDYVILFAALFLLILVSLWGRNGDVREKIETFPLWKKTAVWYSLFLCVVLFGVYGVEYDAVQFIYNQF